MTIVLIGIGHVFALRDRLKEEIHRARPSVVCIELDALRFHILLEDRERRDRGEEPRRAGLDWRRIGRGALILAIIGRVQARLARKFHSRVGDEMLAAVDAARELGVQTRLIDMDSEELFKEWLGKLTLRERVLLFSSAFSGLFASRARVERELKEYFEEEADFVSELAAVFPRTKAMLFDKRNAHMARGIRVAKVAGPVVVAVVGAGHLTGIREELVKAGEAPEEILVVSLRELQGSSRPPPAPPPTNAEFSLTFEPPSGPAPP